MEILARLNRETSEGTGWLHGVVNAIFEEQGIDEKGITFEQFLDVLQEVQRRMAHVASQPRLTATTELPAPARVEQTDELILDFDPKVLDFLKYPRNIFYRLLEEYRCKCVQEGNYAEASKAKEKSEELRRKYL